MFPGCWDSAGMCSRGFGEFLEVSWWCHSGPGAAGGASQPCVPLGLLKAGEEDAEKVLHGLKCNYWVLGDAGEVLDGLKWDLWCWVMLRRF